jgi:hypothetical protein
VVAADATEAEPRIRTATTAAEILVIMAICPFVFGWKDFHPSVDESVHVTSAADVMLFTEPYKILVNRSEDIIGLVASRLGNKQVDTIVRFQKLYYLREAISRYCGSARIAF